MHFVSGFRSADYSKWIYELYSDSKIGRKPFFRNVSKNKPHKLFKRKKINYLNSKISPKTANFESIRREKEARSENFD